MQCFARVLPGRDAEGLPATSEGWGADEKFITLKHDYNSLQSLPEWLDDPTVSIFLLVQIHNKNNTQEMLLRK